MVKKPKSFEELMREKKLKKLAQQKKVVNANDKKIDKKKELELRIQKQKKIIK